MNIQFNNWQLIDPSALDMAINNGANEFFSIFNSFNYFFGTPTVDTNTQQAGFWNGFQYNLLGNHFIDDVPLEIFNSLSLVSGTQNFFASGNTVYNYDTNTISGYFDRLSYSSSNSFGLSNFQLIGISNLDSFGGLASGSYTQKSITNNGNTVSYIGNFNVNANGDISGGVITSFTLQDNFGHKLVVNNASLNAAAIDSLANPLTHSNFTALFNYINSESGLVGNDAITGDVLNNNINGFGGDDGIIGGGGNDTLYGGAGNVTLNGGTGDDILIGGANDDYLNGGLGSDTFNGGTGNDIYILDAATDVILADAGGTDSVIVRYAPANYILSADLDNLTINDGTATGGTATINVAGNALNNTIFGNAGANSLIGNAGSDTLLGGAGADLLDGGTGNDSMNGGLGNDTYIVDSTLDILTEGATFALGGGTDTVQSTVTRTLGLNFDNLTLIGANNINAIGNELANVLTGNDGNNILNGGLGADTLKGGAGNDTYIIDSRLDIIDEELNTDAGDTVKYGVNASATTVSTLTLSSLNTNEIHLTATINASLDLTQIEHLTITGTGLYNIVGNTLNNALIGNAANNSITGGDGNDTLNGGLGLDTLIGGAGDDTYFVGNLAEINLTGETVGGGIDTLNVGFTHSLNDNFENLTLLTVSIDPLTLTLNNINGTGNSLNNTLIGNGGNNILSGLDGDDILNGGLGADTLIGGTGNDTYTIDNALDKVIELAGAGTDTINSSVSYSLVDTDIAIGTAGSFVDNLTLTGALAINGVGNALNNTLTGNNAANILNGLAGDDSINGGAGNDLLIGGLGADALTGGLGADRFDFNLVTETSGLSIDTIADFSHVQLDKIDISTIDAKSGTALINDAFVFIGNAAFSNVAGQLMFDSVTSSIYGDVNGDSVADFQIILTGVTSLLATDFIL